MNWDRVRRESQLKKPSLNNRGEDSETVLEEPEELQQLRLPKLSGDFLRRAVDLEYSLGIPEWLAHAIIAALRGALSTPGTPDEKFARFRHKVDGYLLMPQVPARHLVGVEHFINDCRPEFTPKRLRDS